MSQRTSITSPKPRSLSCESKGPVISSSSPRLEAEWGRWGRAPYAAAKWGVEGFSEVLSKEVGPLGVKVTIIEPGGFRTDFAGSSTDLRRAS
jgi:NAD(P)-dependent dehydrogenase (short-subunit alcohol dehydrogenase family)